MKEFRTYQIAVVAEKRAMAARTRATSRLITALQNGRTTGSLVRDYSLILTSGRPEFFEGAFKDFSEVFDGLKGKKGQLVLVEMTHYTPSVICHSMMGGSRSMGHDIELTTFFIGVLKNQSLAYRKPTEKERHNLTFLSHEFLSFPLPPSYYFQTGDTTFAWGPSTRFQEVTKTFSHNVPLLIELRYVNKYQSKYFIGNEEVLKRVAERLFVDGLEMSVIGWFREQGFGLEKTLPELKQKIERTVQELKEKLNSSDKKVSSRAHDQLVALGQMEIISG